MNQSAEYEEFVRTHVPRLLRYAALLTGGRTEAEDLTQDTMLKAHRHWSKVAAAESPIAYVLRVMVNLNLDRVSRREPERSDPLVQEWAEAGRDEPGFEAAENSMVLRELLGQLPPRQRAAIVLRFYGGYKHDEIADLMDIKPSAARSTLARGIANLKILAAELQEPRSTYPNGATP